MSANWRGRRLGPYQVLEPIGTGGMGAVFRARHVELGVDRALKVILEADPTRRARFLREARHTACVTHPNVVRLHEAGEEHGVAWYAMDLVAGEDLGSVLRRGRLGLDRALGVAIQAAEGVAALHAHGVVHRDLKPQNVMLTSDGRALVIDLGLAVAPEQDERLTRTGAVIGSLAYMAPEQLVGEPATARSDVYALGLVLFELLTGVGAREDSPGALGSALATRRATELAPDLPHAIDGLLDRALAVQPADRFADADALALALRGLRERPGWSRRAMRGAGLASAGAALVILGAVFAAVREGRSASEPRSGSADRFAPQAVVAPPAASERPGLSPAEMDAAEREWEALDRLAGADQLAACEAWLKRFPGHGRTTEVQDLRRAVRLRAPLATVEGAYRIAALGARLVTSSGKGLVQVWELEAEGLKELLRFRVRGRVDEIGALGTSRLVAVTHGPDRMVIHSAQHGRELDHVAIRPEARSLAVSPDGRWAAVGFLRGGLVLVDLEDDLEKSFLLPGDDAAEARALTFSPDSRTLYVGTSAPKGQYGHPTNNSVYRYDVSTRALEAHQPVLMNPTALTCRTDGSALYVGFVEGVLLRHDPRTLAEQAQLEGRDAAAGVSEHFDRRAFAHRSRLRGVHALPGGRLLSVAGDRGPIRPNEFRLWGPDDRELHRWLDLPLECSRSVLSLEGGWFAVRYSNNRVEVWGFPDG